MPTDVYMENSPAAQIVEASASGMSYVDQIKADYIIRNFPSLFEKAREDWAKFKAGVAIGLFSPAQRSVIVQWYQGFPKVWETVRPTWTISKTGVVSPENAAFAKEVDDWVAKLTGASEYRSLSGLGLGPFALVMIGIGIVAGGAGTVLYAYGYYLGQSATHEMVTAVTANKISQETFNRYLAAEKTGTGTGIFGSIFGDVGGTVSKLVTYGAIAAGLYLFWPHISALVRGKKS